MSRSNEFCPSLPPSVTNEHNLTMTRYAYMWRPTITFPRPYEPEEIVKTAGELSPFNYTIEMEKETTKSSAWSLMKHIDWLTRKRESSPFVTSTGDDYFAAERRQRKRMLENMEQDAWEDLMEEAVDNLLTLKRARFDDNVEDKESSPYRKTPRPSLSSRMSRASPSSTPCPSSQTLLSSVPQSSEQISPLTTNGEGH